jgi:hypothetical protein
LGGKSVWQRIDTAQLRVNLSDLIANLHSAIPPETVMEDSTGFRIKTIEVAVKIGAKGEVGILGTGVEASGEASLTLTLERP